MVAKYDVMQTKWMDLGCLFAERTRLQEHVSKDSDVRRGLFDHLQSIGDEFISVVSDETIGLYSPDVEQALNFNRISKGYDVRTSTIREKYRGYFESTFFLGMLTHINIWQFPTRGLYSKVSPDSLKASWVINAITADREMSGYGGTNTIVMGLFEQYYERYVKPDIKKDFNVGMFGIGKYNSYFRNLYLAGAYLVMTCEMATKGL